MVTTGQGGMTTTDSTEARGQGGWGWTGPRRDAGFTMVEVAVGMALLGILIVGMGAALGTGYRYLLTAKQRAATVQAANAILERARAVARNDWTQLGLVPDADDIASDPDITIGSCGASSVEMFSGEPVVFAGGPGTNPLFPHVRTTTVGQTSITLKVYVTGVTSTACSSTNPDMKRVTVLGTWARGQGGVSNEVRLATIVSSAERAPSPGFAGTASYSSGRVLARDDAPAVSPPPPETIVFFPQTSADGQHVGAITVYKGSGITPLGQVAGTQTVDEHKASTIADDDANTAAGRTPPCEANSWSDFVGGLINSNINGSAESCSTLESAADGLPNSTSTASYTNTPVWISPVPGGGDIPATTVRNYVREGAFTATSSVDGEGGVGGQQSLLSTSTVGIPAVNHLEFSISSFNAAQGAVRLGAGSFTARARAGRGVSPADSTMSGAVTFKIYDPTGGSVVCDEYTGSYCVKTVDPTAPSFTGFDATYAVTLQVLDLLLVEVARITITTQVEIPAPAKEITSSGGNVTLAKVTFPMPKINSTVRIESPVGNVLAVVTDQADYGQLVSVASYAPTP